MKYLALDIGEKRVGLAVTDESGIIARPLLTLNVDEGFLEKLGEVLMVQKPNVVILGIPRHQTGEEGKMAGQVRSFAEIIKHEFSVEVDFEDESATSIEAEQRLKSRGLNAEEIKKEVDAEAATIILEAYLARK